MERGFRDMLAEMKKMTVALGKVAASVEKANTFSTQSMKFFRPCLNNIKAKINNVGTGQNLAEVREDAESQPEAKEKDSEVPVPP
jgi:Asp-tRNA(Asn)/Glu-tRNA(Gln) amidotransferase C subunit